MRLVAELAEATRQTATRAQSSTGMLSTTWTYTPAQGMEGLYRLDAHAADGLGNVLQGAAWRGEIDTAAPRAALVETVYTALPAGRHARPQPACATDWNPQARSR